MPWTDLSGGKVVPIAPDLEEPRDPVLDGADEFFVAETLARRVLRFHGSP